MTSHITDTAAHARAIVRYVYILLLQQYRSRRYSAPKHRHVKLRYSPVLDIILLLHNFDGVTGAAAREHPIGTACHLARLKTL